MKGNFKRLTVYTQFDKNRLNKSKLEHKVKNFLLKKLKTDNWNEITSYMCMYIVVTLS
jgi:hypothetical protein